MKANGSPSSSLPERQHVTHEEEEEEEENEDTEVEEGRSTTATTAPSLRVVLVYLLCFRYTRGRYGQKPTDN